MMNKLKFLLIYIFLSVILIHCNTNPNNENIGITAKFINDTILSLKEVQAKNHFVDSISAHKNQITIKVLKKDSLKSNFQIQVGFNRNEFFETYFIFYIDPVTKKITMDDFAQNKRISLEKWRNQNSDSVYTALGMNLLKSESLGKLKLDMKVDNVVYLCGYPDDVSKPLMWEADGLYHQTWVYKTKGIELDLSGENKDDKKISSIKIVNQATLKTLRGIGISSSRQQLLSAYKPEIDTKAEYENSIIAGTIFGGIIFEMEKDEVKSIFIGAAAE